MSSAARAASAPTTTDHHHQLDEDNAARPIQPAAARRVPTTTTTSRTSSATPKRAQRHKQQQQQHQQQPHQLASAGLAHHHHHQSLSSVRQSFASSSSPPPASSASSSSSTAAAQQRQSKAYTSSLPLITSSGNNSSSSSGGDNNSGCNSNSRQSQTATTNRSPTNGGRLTTRTHNSNVYFSDSDEDATSGSRPAQPAAAPVADHRPIAGASASRIQQQHHRRHRQFHRTLVPAESPTASAPQLVTSGGTPENTANRSTDDTGDEAEAGQGPAADRGHVGALLLAAPRPRQSPARLRRISASSSSPTKRGRRVPVADATSSDDCEDDDDDIAAEKTRAECGVTDGAGTGAGGRAGAAAAAAAAASHEKRSMLLSYGPESICVLAFILTTFATFQNAPPKLSRIAAAPAFFPAGSLVHDFPTGHLDTVQTRVKSADISLVLFYAPWSADCQDARLSYEQTARLFYRTAYFSAVNCWQPGGDCRAQYTKIVEWPVTMAYFQTGHAVLYTGRRQTAALSRFVRSLHRPLQRVLDNDGMLRLMHRHDAVVVGFLGATPLRHGAGDQRRYAILYAEAIKWLEHDPFQAVAFAVVTGAAATEAFGVGVGQSALRVYRWNGTVEHEFPANWSQTRMHTWLLGQTETVRATQWLQPPGTKAGTLASAFRAGPVLMMFTPRNGIASAGSANDGYEMLRQVALVYRNCGGANQPWIAEMARVYMTHVRSAGRAEQAEFVADCVRRRRAAELATRAAAKCWSERVDDCRGTGTGGQQQAAAAAATQRFSAASVVFGGNVVNSSKLPSGLRRSLLSGGCCDQCAIGPRNAGDLDLCTDSCQTEEAEEAASSCAAATGHRAVAAANGSKWPRTSMLDTGADERSAANLMRLQSQKLCELQLASEQLADWPQVQFFGVADEAGEDFDRIAGQGCVGNRTLGFVALDSELYGMYAERLGVDLVALADRTAAVIVDHEMESTFVHDGPISTPTLIDFVHNFTARKLQRHLKVESNRLRSPLARHPRVELPAEPASSVEEAATDAAAASPDPSQPADGQHSAQPPPPPPVRQYSPWPADTAVELHQLDARSFVANVAHSNRTVFVLYHSLQCALCAPMSHSLLMVGQLLGGELRSALQLVRIDADRNDLPWQYTVDRVPALIAYPPGRRHVESRIYPSGRAATVPNVLAFVLANLERPVRLHAMVAVCLASKTKYGHLSGDCARAVRTEIRSAIAFSLRQWRTLAHLRGRIIRRLQALQRLLLQTHRTTDPVPGAADGLLQMVQAVRKVWPTTPLLRT